MSSITWGNNPPPLIETPASQNKRPRTATQGAKPPWQPWWNPRPTDQKIVKKKISIIGAGNGGVLTACVCSMAGYPLEIELIYDPSIPAEPVGMGTTPGVPDVLFHTLKFAWNIGGGMDGLRATKKMGLRYTDWGKKNPEFWHMFISSSLGMHFTPQLMQDNVLRILTELKKITVRHENITDEFIKTLDSDFIFDCRGKPKNKEEFDRDYIKLYNPLNSVILGSKEPKPVGYEWTDTMATPNGWTFGIPLPDSYNLGYLYNENITKENEAINDFEKRYQVETAKTLKFQNYMAKEFCDKDKRIFKNGNRLAFIEPLEALSMDIHINWASDVMIHYIAPQCFGQPATPIYRDDRLENLIGRTAEVPVEEYRKRTIHEIEIFLGWHYIFGSSFESKFWEEAPKLVSLEDDHFKMMCQISMDPNLQSIRMSKEDQFHFGAHSVYSIRNWLHGMNGDNYIGDWDYFWESNHPQYKKGH